MRLRTIGTIALLALSACRPKTDFWYNPTNFEDSGVEDASEGGAPDATPTTKAKIVAVAVGTGHVCAVTESGRVFCWGNNSNGQTSEDGSQQTPAPFQVPNINAARLIAAGATHSCVTEQSGKVQCWGSADQGELGMNTSLSRQTQPVTVMINGADTDRSLGLGNRFSCARDVNDAVHCWGRNDGGRLGYSSNSDATQTLQLDSGMGTTLTTVRLAVGSDHGCAETVNAMSEHDIYCWGSRAAGQSGNGVSAAPYERPTLLDDRAGIAMRTPLNDLVAGSTHTCFVPSGGPNAGKAFCLGSNGFGQLGNGTTNNSDTPVNALNTASIIRLAAGDTHTCALSGPSGSGTIWCWGNNDSRQVGSPSPSIIAHPQVVNIHPEGSELHATEIAAGGNTTCAIAAGRLFCWGAGNDGQLVTASTTDVPTEIEIRE
jgi:alpha-tubulin suppressor-like RCC1 family protein